MTDHNVATATSDCFEPAWAAPEWAATVAEIERLSRKSHNRPHHTQRMYDRYWRSWHIHCESMGEDPENATFTAWRSFIGAAFEGKLPSDGTQRAARSRKVALSPASLEVLVSALKDRYRDLDVEPAIHHSENVHAWNQLIDGYKRSYGTLPDRGQGAKKPVLPLGPNELRAVLAVEPVLPPSGTPRETWLSALLKSSLPLDVPDFTSDVCGIHILGTDAGLVVQSQAGEVGTIAHDHVDTIAWSPWCSACVLLDNADEWLAPGDPALVKRMLSRVGRQQARRLEVLADRTGAVNLLWAQARIALSWTLGVPSTEQMPTIVRSQVQLRVDGSVTVEHSGSLRQFPASGLGRRGVAETLTDWVRLWDAKASMVSAPADGLLFPNRVTFPKRKDFAVPARSDNVDDRYQAVFRAAGLAGLVPSSVLSGFIMTATAQGYDEADIAAAVGVSYVDRIAKLVRRNTHRSSRPIQVLVEAITNSGGE